MLVNGKIWLDYRGTVGLSCILLFVGDRLFLSFLQPRAAILEEQRLCSEGEMLGLR